MMDDASHQKRMRKYISEVNRKMKKPTNNDTQTTSLLLWNQCQSVGSSSSTSTSDESEAISELCVSRIRYSGPPTLPDEMKGVIPAPPRPANNTQYLPIEAIPILASINVYPDKQRKNEQLQVQLHTYWRKVGLVPVSDSTLRRMTCAYTNGKQLPPIWYNNGKPPIMKADEILVAGKKFQESEG